MLIIVLCLHPTWDETCILSMWIWVVVSNFPNTATRNYYSVPSYQFPILPHNILPVCSVAELFIALPWVWKILHSPDIIPDPSGKSQHPLLQNVHFHVGQHGNAGAVLLFSTALSFYICWHLYAVSAHTPSGLTRSWRALWRSISWCWHMEEIKDEAWVPCQADLQQLMGFFQAQCMNSGL